MNNDSITLYPEAVAIELATTIGCQVFKCELPTDIGNLECYQINGPHVWMFAWSPIKSIQSYLYSLKLRLRLVKDYPQILEMERTVDHYIANRLKEE